MAIQKFTIKSNSHSLIITLDKRPGSLLESSELCCNYKSSGGYCHQFLHRIHLLEPWKCMASQILWHRAERGSVGEQRSEKSGAVLIGTCLTPCVWQGFLSWNQLSAQTLLCCLYIPRVHAVTCINTCLHEKILSTGSHIPLFGATKILWHTGRKQELRQIFLFLLLRMDAPNVYMYALTLCCFHSLSSKLFATVTEGIYFCPWKNVPNQFSLQTDRKDSMVCMHLRFSQELPVRPGGHSHWPLTW